MRTIPGSARDRDLARDLKRALTLACDLARDDPFGAAYGVARDLGLARGLVGTRTRDLADARDLAHSLKRDLGVAHDLARDLGVAHVRARDLGVALGSAFERALGLGATLDRALEGADQGQRRTVQMAPLAGRLLAAAARLLPAGDRARYAEEFRSELAEIARARAGRRPQLAYAARQVMSARRLRTDLRAPRRRRAAS
jgi:hypothetical protein